MKYVASCCLDVVEHLIEANEWVDIKLKTKKENVSVRLEPALWTSYYQGLKNTWISACPLHKQCWNKCSLRALSKLWFRYKCVFLTKHKEVKMAGYWPSCFLLIFMDQDKVKVMCPSCHLTFLIISQSEHRICFSVTIRRFSYIYITSSVIRKIKHLIYGKREFVLCMTKFSLYLLARKSVDSLQFCPCFKLFLSAHFSFWKFLTWLSRLLFGVNALLNHDLGLTYQTGKFICPAWWDRTFLQALIIWNDYISN